jgi:hypothetical protein
VGLPQDGGLVEFGFLVAFGPGAPWPYAHVHGLRRGKDWLEAAAPELFQTAPRREVHVDDRARPRRPGDVVVAPAWWHEPLTDLCAG